LSLYILWFVIYGLSWFPEFIYSSNVQVLNVQCHLMNGNKMVCLLVVWFWMVVVGMSRSELCSV